MNTGLASNTAIKVCQLRLRAPYTGESQLESTSKKLQLHTFQLQHWEGLNRLKIPYQARC